MLQCALGLPNHCLEVGTTEWRGSHQCDSKGGLGWGWGGDRAVVKTVLTGGIGIRTASYTRFSETNSGKRSPALVSPGFQRRNVLSSVHGNWLPDPSDSQRQLKYKIKFTLFPEKICYERQNSGLLKYVHTLTSQNLRV